MEILTDALILIIEDKLCTRCGASTRSPHGLFIRCRNGRNKTVYKKIDEIPIRSFLHVEKKVVGTSTNACEHCFPAEDERQLQLFPSCFGARFLQLDEGSMGEAPAPSPKKKKQKKEKPEVKMLQLSEF